MSETTNAPKRLPEESAEIGNDVKKPQTESVAGASASGNGVSESDVGITHFLTPENPGFKGQIKQRYSDFMVNEIDLEGNVVYLKDRGFKRPQKPQPSAEELKTQQEEESKRRQEFELDGELKQKLVEALGESDVEKIMDVFKHAQKMETERSFEDKFDRTKVHQLLREAFNNELESVTTEDNTFKIARSNRKTRVDKKTFIEQTKDANGVENWGYGPAKDFIHLTLYKENKDTMDAINIIAKYLRLPARAMRSSGTKDRRAVTCQRLSVSRIGLDRLNALNRTLKGMVLGGYKFEDRSLSLGDLKGNEFVVVIRDAKLHEGADKSLDQVLKDGCQSLAERGFVNYFGMQRFGTFSISTHVVGKELLLNNWQGAAELILSDQDSVLPTSKEARKIWSESKDANSAMKKMPRQCVAENAILSYLSTQKKEEDGQYSANAYYTAIMKIPRNLRTMYVHAYQSFVWNTIASKRIEMYGLNVMEGDLVISENDESKAADSLEEDEFDEDVRTAQFVRARPITKDEIESQKFKIEDVVLPTPGFDIVYPPNQKLSDLYVEIMKKDAMDPFDMRRKVRDFSLAGSYRNVIQKPAALDYRIIHYSSPTQQLINTDLEILHNQRAKDNCQKYMKEKLDRFTPDKGGEHTAVVLKFQLGVSAYATMVLRELMKVESSRRGDMCDVKV
ncbi:hypothetical protein ZYGR_0S02120 [Zygosaccharomyces rouxii]|uniref:ZYRO0F07260p n=2 Tax=Zygosaccharomyces rouxii TaxID=4956 RepID=C5DXR7_ZYGRC|nr:uncharacterized protein ZYRO0F07260g [Zygosaccharomyces rouxii]KAH9199338.1 pseudouridine synthase [Zygosaccharomyces rouxii]GAV50078.1 hypothetical protein ZYGR_0S02120 [Zygosaccharomyces rouxii]CAR28578.1 ZYRO0F07260p [Zygosaccharomyces rouxii]